MLLPPIRLRTYVPMMAGPLSQAARALPCGGAHPNQIVPVRCGTGGPAARRGGMRARERAGVAHDASRRSDRAHVQAQGTGDGRPGRRQDLHQRAACPATRGGLSYDGAPASRPQSDQHHGQEPQADVGSQGHHRQAREDARRERIGPPPARGAPRGPTCGRRDASGAAAQERSRPAQERSRPPLSGQLPHVLHGGLSDALERRVLRVHADLPRAPLSTAGPGSGAGPAPQRRAAEAARGRGGRLPFAGVGAKAHRTYAAAGSP